MSELVSSLPGRVARIGKFTQASITNDQGVLRFSAGESGDAARIRSIVALLSDQDREELVAGVKTDNEALMAVAARALHMPERPFQSRLQVDRAAIALAVLIAEHLGVVTQG